MTALRGGVLSIVTGTAAGQLLALASAPMLARLYRPADLGVFTVFSALVITAGTVAALRFELAIPLPAREEDAAALVRLGFACAALTAVIGTLGVAAGSGWLVARIGEPALAPWLWFVPASAALVGGYQVLNQLAIRQRRFAAIGRRSLVQAAVTLTGQVALGAGGLRPAGLIAGFALGQCAAIAGLARSVRPAGGRGRLAAMARRYRRFPLVLAPSGLLNVLGTQLPAVLVAIWYGSEAAGWLGLTQRVLALPVALIGTAIAQVYLAEVAQAVRTDHRQARALFLRASRTLALLGFAGAVTLFLAAPVAFSAAFGAAWAPSGGYAQLLAISLAAQFVAAPLSQTLIVFERQLAQFGWDAGRLAAVVLAVAVCGALHAPATVAVLAFGSASAVAYVASWLLSLATVLHHRPRRPLDLAKESNEDLAAVRSTQ